jgi:predicted GNAT superfamily acetyltransferase
MPSVNIRLLKTHREFKECERIQKGVWGALGVASEVMIVSQRYGGVVLGAFERGRLVGFLYAFLARRRGRLMHWSHMMAVLPRFRDRGLGFRMKLAHRRLALDRGVKSIGWTFDPLQSRNAALNIFRLGARVEEFLPDLYGHFPSRIEKGLASDRFVVNWPIASPAVERRLKEGAPRLRNLRLQRVNETRLNSKELLQNRRIFLNLREPRLLVEIPANTDEIRRRSIGLARRWRLETQKIFQTYFSAGYRVADFMPPSPATAGRCFYVLRRQRSRQFRPASRRQASTPVLSLTL